jgi:protein TonB
LFFIGLYIAGDNVATDSVYTTVDIQPEFPGGRKALGKYVDGKNHRYPEEAQKNRIEGKVVIQFIINEDGTPSDFEVIEGIGYGCDEAALEAFKKMPKWKPGLVDGVPVKVRTRMGYMYKL